MGRFASKQQRLELYYLQEGKCNFCHVELEQGFHVDHIVPFSKQGKTCIKNLQALCPTCHREKHHEKDSYKRGN